VPTSEKVMAALEPLPLSPRPDAAVTARSYIADVGRRLNLGESVLADLQLLTSELVTNAVRHAGTPMELTVTVSDCVTVMVHDIGEGEPQITAKDVGGWGLRFVDTLSSRWGVLPAEPGKIVWFDLPLQ
jgi:anti-sigma regulatory factor (Ser/Thr protein kinase)